MREIQVNNLNNNKMNNNTLLIEDILVPRTFPKMKYCIFYLTILLSLFLPFLLNYIMTSNAFEANQYHYIPSEYLCNTTLESLKKCIANHTPEECKRSETIVKDCYNKASHFNKKCYVYISEICLCKEKNKACKWIMSDLKECAQKYQFINIEKMSNHCSQSV